MIYNEKIKDIFKVKNVDLVAHCIAKDAHMGAGIAVMFDRRYPGMKQGAKKASVDIGDIYLWNLGRKIKSNRPPVANLITKASSYGKPTYEDFEKTIISLRQLIIDCRFKTVAMPMIGAGLDKLSWKKQVLPCLMKHLYDLDIELTIYFTNENSRNNMYKFGTGETIIYNVDGKSIERFMLTNNDVMTRC